MTIHEVKVIDFDYLQITKPRCAILGIKFPGRRCDVFIHKEEMLFFDSEQDLVEYCDSLIAIYEPHERPTDIFVQYINRYAE